MKLLISGATGFIGKHLVTKLIDEKHHISIITRPSTKNDTFGKKVVSYVFDNDVDKLVAFMEKEKFDGVIHLASLFLAQHKAENIQNLIESNLFFSSALLEASVKTNTPWFINTGTFWQHYKNKKYSPVNLYAATKQAFETIAQYYVETSRINFVTIKLCDTFGPDDTRAKVFNLWVKSTETGETLDMSPGEQLIDISYIDNIIDGYLKMITALSKDKLRKLSGKSFAISSSKIVSLKKLASIFEKVSGKKLTINWGGKSYRAREVMKPWNTGTKIPGWKPAVSLEDGIKKTLAKIKSGNA